MFICAINGGFNLFSLIYFMYLGIDCGPPPETPGSTYGYYADTRYKASFFFGCEETFTLAGKSSMNDNIIRCQSDGTWDFGDLRCEGNMRQLYTLHNKLINIFTYYSIL